MNSPFEVLLIEDDPDETALVKRRLEAPDADRPFRVTAATRLPSAFQLLSRGVYDAVILDLALPQSVGLEGFHKLRAQFPRAAVVVTAALHDEALARDAVRLGAQDYVIKGTLDHCVLKRVLRHAAGRRRLLDGVEALLAADPAGKAVVDDAGRVLFANAEAERLLGSTLSGRHFPHALGDGASELEGALGPIELRAERVDWEGAPARLVTVLDLREEAELRSLRKERSERESVAEAKGTLMGRAGHELRNTLAAVKTAAFCLSDPGRADDGGRASRLAEMIARNVDRQTKLLDDILDLARPAGPGEGRAVDVAQVLAEAAREAALTRAQPKLELEAPTHLPAVTGDPDRLLQAVRHLVENALCHAKARVVLSAGLAANGELSVTVADDGPGLPRERLDTIFSPFARLAESREGGEGKRCPGLGLAFAREIVDAHGGRLWAESPDGGGARFHIALPRREPRGPVTAETTRIDRKRVQPRAGGAYNDGARGKANARDKSPHRLPADR